MIRQLCYTDGSMKLYLPSSFTITIAVILLILSGIVLSLRGAEVKTLNLKLDWKGPAGWQTNGVVFNIRIYSYPFWLSDQNNWPVTRSVTNAVTTTLTNVSPTQMYAITLKCPNGDTSHFVGPVTAQYLLQ